MADDAALQIDALDEEEEDFFFMANLHPEDTGLPRIIWVSERGLARHDVRVKVFTGASNRVRRDDIAVMSVRPSPELLHGRLPSDEVEAVGRWITLNEAVILDYWEGRATTAQLLHRIRKVVL